MKDTLSSSPSLAERLKATSNEFSKSRYHSRRRSSLERLRLTYGSSSVSSSNAANAALGYCTVPDRRSDLSDLRARVLTKASMEPRKFERWTSDFLSKRSQQSKRLQESKSNPTQDRLSSILAQMSSYHSSTAPSTKSSRKEEEKEANLSPTIPGNTRDRIAQLLENYTSKPPTVKSTTGKESNEKYKPPHPALSFRRSAIRKSFLLGNQKNGSVNNDKKGDEDVSVSLRSLADGLNASLSEVTNGKLLKEEKIEQTKSESVVAASENNTDKDYQNFPSRISELLSSVREQTNALNEKRKVYENNKELRSANLQRAVLHSSLEFEEDYSYSPDEQKFDVDVGVTETKGEENVLCERNEVTQGFYKEHPELERMIDLTEVYEFYSSLGTNNKRSAIIGLHCALVERQKDPHWRKGASWRNENPLSLNLSASSSPADETDMSSLRYARSTIGSAWEALSSFLKNAWESELHLFDQGHSKISQNHFLQDFITQARELLYAWMLNVEALRCHVSATLEEAMVQRQSRRKEFISNMWPIAQDEFMGAGCILDDIVEEEIYRRKLEANPSTENLEKIRSIGKHWCIWPRPAWLYGRFSWGDQIPVGTVGNKKWRGPSSCRVVSGDAQFIPYAKDCRQRPSNWERWRIRRTTYYKDGDNDMVAMKTSAQQHDILQETNVKESEEIERSRNDELRILREHLSKFEEIKSDVDALPELKK
eukprot:g3363.t1